MPRIKSTLTPQYEFDPRLGTTGRYVDKSTGRIVPRELVTDAMEMQISDSRQKINSLSRQLANGEISISEWQLAMRNNIRVIHSQAAALAKGGWAQMSQSDWGAVGPLSAKQYFYLQRFALQIEEGKQKLLNVQGEINGQFMRRADLYGQAGNATYHKMEDRTALQSGLTEEMRILDPLAVHCDCCIDQAGHWEPIGTLIEIGGCTCSQKCRCDKEYR